MFRDFTNKLRVCCGATWTVSANWESRTPKGVREEDECSDGTFKHRQVASHEEPGEARMTSTKLCEEHLLMSLHPRSGIGSVLVQGLVTKRSGQESTKHLPSI